MFLFNFSGSFEFESKVLYSIDFVSRFVKVGCVLREFNVNVGVSISGILELDVEMCDIIVIVVVIENIYIESLFKLFEKEDVREIFDDGMMMLVLLVLFIFECI